MPVEPVPELPAFEFAPALEALVAVELPPEPALVAEPDSPPPLVAAPEVPPPEVEPIVPEEPPSAVALPPDVVTPLAVVCKQQPAASANGAQTSGRARAFKRRRLFRASVGSTLSGDGDLFVVRRNPGLVHFLSFRGSGSGIGVHAEAVVAGVVHERRRAIRVRLTALITKAVGAGHRHPSIWATVVGVTGQYTVPVVTL